MLRLAEVYISLCKAGEVSHLKWKHEFQCTPRLTGNHSLTDDLTRQSYQMEQCFQQWRDELHSKRLQYSELNHFTTRQLLFLRNKLAVVQGRGPRAVDGIPLEVYNLLESVLPGVEPGSLKSVLLFCDICSQETGENIVRSYGGGSTFQSHIALGQRTLLKGAHLSMVEMFQSLVANLESIGTHSDPEEIAIAAMISCKVASEADLIVWCVKNANNKDLINAKYTEALDDPRYLALVKRDVSTSMEEER